MAHLVMPGEQKACELTLEEIEAKLRSRKLDPMKRISLSTTRVTRLIETGASHAHINKAQKAQLRAIKAYTSANGL